MNVLRIFWNFLILLGIENVLGEISIEHSAQVIEGIYRRFHSKYLFLLTDSKASDLSSTKKLHQLFKLLSKERVYTSIVQLQDLKKALNVTQQGYRLPLVVIPQQNPSIQKVLNAVSPKMAEWLIFQFEFTLLEEKLSNLYIPLDCEFLVVQQFPEGVVEVKEVYHISQKSPLEILTLGTWTPNEGLEWITNGFYRRRRNLHGIVLKVAVSENDLPTTLTKDHEGHVKEVGGFLGQIWAELENRLNFRYFEVVQEKWVKRKYNGTSGMIGIVARNEADAAIGAFTMYRSRVEAVDFLIPLLEDDTHLYIRELETLELHWSSFLSPFKKHLWLAVIAALVILSAVFMFSNYMAVHNINSIENMIESFYCIYGAFCGQGRERQPKSWPCRIVLLTAFLVGYVVVAAYAAALISFLTVQRNELPFTSFQGLLRDGTYKLGITVGAELSYFSESKNIIMRRLYSKLLAPKKDHFHENVVEGFMRLCEEDKYALVTSDMWLLRLQSGDVSCNIQKVPQTNIPGSVSIAVTKGSPYRTLFNHNLRQMWLSGILQKLRKSYWSNDVPKMNRKSFGVTFAAVAPIFTLLSIGIVVSIFLLCLEHGIFNSIQIFRE